MAEAQTVTYDKEGANLIAVPDNIPTNTTIVKLSSNRLTVINSTGFSSLVNLKELSLNLNQISSIASDAFDNTRLTKLDLSHNPIQTVTFFAAIDRTLITLILKGCQISDTTWDLVIHYSKLNSLTLDDNQITAVPNVSNSANSLESLLLTGNPIEVIEAAKLDGCHKLKTLFLIYSPLTRVDGILKLNNLRNLYLQFNQLNQFPNLSYLQQLEILHLSENKISDIPNDCFANNSKLQEIYMSKNKISKMPNLDGARNSLTKLHMSDNSNITFIPTDYFKDCTKLTEIVLNGLSATAITFARSIGPSVEKLLLKEGKITDVPADIFHTASGMKQIDLEKNKISNFEISNIQYMPRLSTLRLQQNNMTKIGNASKYCNGVTCGSLNLYITENQIPCDYYMCWAKKQTSITVSRDACLGKLWVDLTLEDLPCPIGNVCLTL